MLRKAFIVRKTRISGYLSYLYLILMFGCGNPSAPIVPSQTNQSSRSVQHERPAQIEERTATFLAVGDIMLSRGVNRAIEQTEDPLFPFSQLDKLLDSSDFNFGNLESPASGNEKRLGKGLVFNSHQHDLAGLARYNFRVLNLANNHAFDQGLAGLRFTKHYLETNRILSLGVGVNKTEAWEAKIIEVNEIKIGFIGASYASINDGGFAINVHVARIEEFERLKLAVRKLKLESDFIVVTMHAGIEYTRKPNSLQTAFAHTAIEAGADLVIGGHPHWIQTIEKYRGRYIFYSLGNFIFDQKKSDTREGLMLRISLSKIESGTLAGNLTRLSQIELIPIIIGHLNLPRPATLHESAAILKKIGVSQTIIRPDPDV